MRSCVLAVVLAFMVSACSGGVGTPWLEFEPGEATPTDAAGRGLHVVLVSGDEEYRSEEALPQLAAILSERHGFRCTVLFSIDPETGTVDPDERKNIPGLAALEDADCLVLFTRFRDLPDQQMAFIDSYLRAGKPVLGIRTATHAFNLSGERSFARYTWNHDPGETEEQAWGGGFGRLVLGETWIAHHGAHGRQSTRGEVAPDAADHPIARGLGEPGTPVFGMEGVWGPTDVYRVRLPMADGVQPIVLGRVLDGMDADSPGVGGELNDPLMPIVWAKRYRLPGGAAGESVTSTIGASVDLVASGTRRVLVNAVYWLCGLGDEIPEGGADARIVGVFEPSPYGFGGARKGLLPASFSPFRGAKEPRQSPATLELREGDRLVLIGNTFAERLAASGYFAAMAHAAHPGLSLSVRHIPWSADEVGNRPRERGVPTTLERLHELDASVIVACYGMSESFAGESGLDAFDRDLRAYLDTLTGTPFDGETPPRVALVSPIVHEDLGAPWVTGAALAERNRLLALYTETMRRAAADAGVVFCDLLSLPGAEEAGPLTTNGIHPSEDGARVYTERLGSELGWLREARSDASDAELEAASRLRRLAADQYYHERLWYRPTNTEYVYGRRHEPFGIVNFPPEIEQLERMIDARDRALGAGGLTNPAALFEAPLGERPVWEDVPTSRDFPEDSWTPDPVVAKGTETSLGDLEIKDPEEFVSAFTLADGYTVEAFASERAFPDLANPLAMTFDESHRLWVICATTYPHLLPGERPSCKIIVLEDTDADGRADRRTTFADDLYIPTGFAVDLDCVYVGQAPDLLRLRDTDGDGAADRREVVYTGFAMPDSHHTISAFEWDPHGGFLMHEGVFCVTGVETPWGTMRSVDAAVWRFDTRTGRLTRLSHAGFANPWGHAFDDFGQSVLADASGGANFSFSHVINGSEGVRKPGRGAPILNRGRPTAGCEIIASRHFPEDVQGTFLVNQSIGFHGTRWSRLIEPSGDASAWSAEAMEQDLLESSDVNFRPVAMEIGPDGTLFIVDWSNPIIGHMQYSVRDPRRDATHGRIWRIRHRTRETLTPPQIPSAETVRGRLALFDLLRLPERNTRRHARRRLQRADPGVVLPEFDAWLSMLDPGDPLRERLRLERLWLARAHGVFDLPLLDEVASSPDARVRAGAVRVLRHWLDEGGVAAGPALRVLARCATDPDMRVRLEAVIAAGFVPSPDAAAVVETAAALPADAALTIAIEEAIRFLSRLPGEPTDFARTLELEAMPVDALLAAAPGGVRDRVVLARADVPLALRREAADRLGAMDDPGLLLELVLGARSPDEAADAIAPIVLEQDAQALRTARATATRLAERKGRAGTLGLAVLARVGALDADDLPGGERRLVEFAELMPAGTLDPILIDRLLDAGKGGAVDPESVVRALAPHAIDASLRDRLVTTLLDEWVRPAEARPLSGWDGRSALAAAGLLGLAEVSSVAGGELDIEGRYLVERADDAALAAGRAVFLSESVGCARCHAEDGSGLEGFPPLASSAWVHGTADRSIAIVLHGLFGEISMPGDEAYNSAMAPLGQLLDDEQVASVLTYVRQSFGNFASPVDASRVASVRAMDAPRQGMWRPEEILDRYPLDDETVVPGVVPDRTLRASARGSDKANSGGASIATTLVVLSLVLAAIGAGALAVIFRIAARVGG